MDKEKTLKLFKVMINGMPLGEYKKLENTQNLEVPVPLDLPIFENGITEGELIPFTTHRGADLPSKPMKLIKIQENPDGTYDLRVGTDNGQREYILKKCIRKHSEENESQ